MFFDRGYRSAFDSAISIWPGRLKTRGIELLSGSTARKGLVTLADQAVVSGTNFVTGVIIGRNLPKEEFGLYMLGFSIVIFVTTIQNAIISSPYIVYSPRRKDVDHANYTGSTLIHQLALSIIAIASLLIASVVLSKGIGPRGLAPVVLALALAISFIMLRDYVRQLCFASLRMKNAFLLDLCVAIAQIGGLLLLMHFGILSARFAYWTIGFACSLPTLTWLLRSRKKFNLSIKKAFSDLSFNWSFAKWVFSASVTMTLSRELNSWFLACFHGMAAIGILSACRGAIFLTNPLLLAMTNIIRPKTSHALSLGGRKELDRVVVVSTFVFVLPTVVFCLILFLFGGRIVSFVYGAKYAGYGLIVSILSFIPFIATLTLPTTNALLAIERSKCVFLSYLASGTVTLLLGIPLISAFGLVGAASTMLCSTTVGAIYRLWIYWVHDRNSERKGKV